MSVPSKMHIAEEICDIDAGILRVKLLSIHAKAPTRGTEDAAGLDLYCDLSDYPGARIFSRDDPRNCVRIPQGGRLMIPTHIAIACPPGYYARIAPRSSLALKHGIDVLAGVVDADYRGEVGVVLQNNGDQSFLLKHNERIAQIIIEKIAVLDPVVVDELPKTARGAGGFGSTGA